MTASGMFLAAPELAMSWGGLYIARPEERLGSTAVNCAHNFYKGKCCLTCASTADEVYGLSGDEEEVTIEHIEDHVRCGDGTTLRYQLWDAHFPEGVMASRGLVVVLHDFSTESGRACRNLVPRLISEGYAVASFDLRGHGRSSDRTDGYGPGSHIRRIFAGSRRFVVDGDDCWLQMQRWRGDVETVVRRALADIDDDEAEVFLLGDGFGASIAIDFVINADAKTKTELRISGVAACGAVLGLSEDLSFEEVYAVLDERGTSRVEDGEYFIFPNEFEALSRDLRVGEMIRKDSLRLKQTSALVLKAAVRIVENASKASQTWDDIPLAFFHGTKDLCAPLDAVEEFKNHTTGSHVTLNKYSGAKHWLHHEILPARSTFLDDLMQWIIKHR